MCVCLFSSLRSSQFKSLLDAGLQKVFRNFMVVFFFFFSHKAFTPQTRMKVGHWTTYCRTLVQYHSQNIDVDHCTCIHLCVCLLLYRFIMLRLAYPLSSSNIEHLNLHKDSSFWTFITTSTFLPPHFQRE